MAKMDKMANFLMVMHKMEKMVSMEETVMEMDANRKVGFLEIMEKMELTVQMELMEVTVYQELAQVVCISMLIQSKINIHAN